MHNSKTDGFHYLLEFFGCDVEQINDVSFWKKELHASINGTTMEALHDFFFEFEPVGLTGYLLLSSSHISIHTWPEKKYVVCDVFTCSSENETEQTVQYLKDTVTHERVISKKIQRGFKVSRIGAKIKDDKQCTFDRHCMELPIYANGESMMLDVVQVIIEIENSVQKIQIVDTVSFGKCLIIDGVMQTAQKDHYLYDRELIKKLQPDDKDILILGGGDGYVAQRVISENPYAQVVVDVVELDIEVVKACERYLGQDVFKKDNVNLHIGDALHYLRTTEKKYDGVIFDLTDAPIGPTEDFIQFYQDLCAYAHEKTRENGWIAIQSGTSAVTAGYIDMVAIIKTILKETKWRNIKSSDVMIPSYGESCAFLFADK